MHCTNCGMQKATVKLKYHFSSEKSKPKPYPLLSYACLKSSVSQSISLQKILLIKILWHLNQLNLYCMEVY